MPHRNVFSSHLSRACACILLVVALAVVAPPAPGATPPPGTAIIVLDASGSMRALIRGETKMAIAKRAIRDLVTDLPAGTPLGLVAYSHRRDDACDDIELLLPPAPLDAKTFIAAVDAIGPKGRTPLTASVRFAAEALESTKRKATVILVSDGAETCGENPCTVARALEKAALDLTVHVIGFDLSAAEARGMACLADETGGRFLQANDAATLKDALAVVAAETAAATPAPAEALTAANVSGPAQTGAGTVIEIAWTGPDNPGDCIVIVPTGAPDSEYGSFNYTRQGSPLRVTAPIDPGDAEVRYVTARTRTVLARAPLTIIRAEVTLDAPASAVAGSEVRVAWTGPANPGDYITIVPQTSDDSTYARYVQAEAGKPVATITAPIDPVPAEIRYVSGQGRRVLARRALRLEKVAVSLKAADEAVAGSDVSITWTGPAAPGDYITIVPASAADGASGRYAYTKAGESLVRVTAPLEQGPGEIRYISGQGNKVLERRLILLLPATITLSAPDEAEPGAAITVTWTGPNNAGDYLTIVPREARDDVYLEYKYTKEGSPLTLLAPVAEGAAEIRYVAGQGRAVLARRALRVIPSSITLEAPSRAVAGTPVAVAWTGPDGRGDFITIVPRGAADGSYQKYAYTARGTPASVIAPEQAGPAEIRYMTGLGSKVLKRVPIEITAP